MDKFKSLPLAIAVASVCVMLSPLPSPTRIVVGLSGGALCLFQSIDARSRKERASKFEEGKKQEVERQLAQAAIKQQEIEAGLLALEIEEKRLSREKAIAEAQIKEERERLKTELAREQDGFLRELTRIEQEQKQKLEADLEASRAAIVAQMGNDIKALQDTLNALEREREEKVRAIESELAGYREQWERSREEQRLKDVTELEQAEEALAAQYIESRDQLLKELEELKTQLKTESRREYESWLVPHCQAMDAKLKEIEAFKGTVMMLREQIAESRDIKLSGLDGTEEGDRADKVLIWLKQNGQYCDYCSATILPDSTFVLNFMPWVAGAKSERAIKGLLIWMVPKFGLREPPLFQANGEARSWTLTMLPARSRSGGRAVPPTMTRLDDFYSRQIDQEIEAPRNLEAEVREGVQQRLNYESQVAEMMAFRPPVPLPKPRSHQITELELACFKWFYFWRSLATNGDEPNITTREGLLYYVYGVREGRATSTYDPIMCESLGHRATRVLEMLRVEAIQLQEEGEGEDE